MVGHCQKFLGGGVLKAKILVAKYEAKLEFLGGRGGGKTKNLPWGEYGYFLDLQLHTTQKMLQKYVLKPYDSRSHRKDVRADLDVMILWFLNGLAQVMSATQIVLSKLH